MGLRWLNYSTIFIQIETSLQINQKICEFSLYKYMCLICGAKDRK
ncbi:hypothetical protein EUBHAL_01033 [Anaerobutyricum hallii DSM 3353]|jgi:hypothetical protein|uniref:Uncharacterized protein n=1 Tax=Anaerobutyricum hallii DSM 3353 TaxID=411469 RepID=C0EUE9_9FIRM|nr:hypothetical protein EUBHAL_01033 [Anaerobutyricum hallii DSM 3353]